MSQELEARLSNARSELDMLKGAQSRAAQLEEVIPNLEAEKKRYDEELAGMPAPVTPENDDTTGEGNREGEPAPAQPEDGSVQTEAQTG